MRAVLQLVAALIGALWLVGAACADVAQDPPKETEKIPQSIWQVAPNGMATHLQSSFVCSPEVGSFKRSKLIVYDRSGFDVSCGYNGRHGWITVYLTKLGTISLADAFADAKRQLVANAADATPLPDADQKTFVGVGDFLHLIYTEKNGALWSGIWMADFSGWMFEFRASYRPDAQDEMFEEMAELARGATATAGAHLAICAKQAPITRDGVAVADKDAVSKAMMMVSLFGAVKVDAAKKQAEKPLHWCAESIVGPYPGVFWHAVNDDGSDGLADRVTPVSIDDPVSLMSAPDLMAALLSGDKQANNGPQWFVSLKLGSKMWFFAIYKGRPPADALGQIMSDIAEHKAKAIGGYSVDGKSITINMPPP